jgi:hypothetical protein
MAVPLGILDIKFYPENVISVLCTKKMVRSGLAIIKLSIMNFYTPTLKLSNQNKVFI